MLTKEEKDYLSKIDPSKKVSVHPFNPKGKILGKSIVKQINNHFPNLEVLFMGSVALGISGQKDIDIYALANSEEFGKYLPTFEKMFGILDKQGKYVKKTFVEWKFQKDGYEIEVYLTEPPERQIKVYEILKSNRKLLKEYEELKLSFDGKSYKDYQEAKYEFYNRILTTDAKDFLGKKVEVVMDRPFGSKHPKHRFLYEANYGYICNTKSPDGEELDAYYLGVDKPLKKAKGICIAVIHRTNDNDDKLVVVPEGLELSNQEIKKQIHFQEQWFEYTIIRLDMIERNFQIIEFKSEYQDQVIDVVGRGLMELNVIPKSDKPLQDEDLYQIPNVYKGRGRFWIAVKEDKVIGTVAIRDMGGDTAKLNRMFVLSKYHSKGVGQALFDHAIAFAKKQCYKEVILNTHFLMKRAHSFYEKNGFKKVRKEQDKYHYKMDL